MLDTMVAIQIALNSGCRNGAIGELEGVAACGLGLVLGDCDVTIDSIIS